MWVSSIYWCRSSLAMTSLCNANLRPKWHFFWRLKIPLVYGVNDPRRKTYCSLSRLLLFGEVQVLGYVRLKKTVQGKYTLNKKQSLPWWRWCHGQLLFIHWFQRFLLLFLLHHNGTFTIPHDNMFLLLQIMNLVLFKMLYHLIATASWIERGA